MKFRKEGKKIFSIGQTFYFSYLQMTMSKQCNKMTFLIYSLLHLVNLGDIFPSRAFKGKLLNKGRSASLPPSSGSAWSSGRQEGGWSGEGVGYGSSVLLFKQELWGTAFVHLMNQLRNLFSPPHHYQSNNYQLLKGNNVCLGPNAKLTNTPFQEL